MRSSRLSAHSYLYPPNQTKPATQFFGLCLENMNVDIMDDTVRTCEGIDKHLTASVAGSTTKAKNINLKKHTGKLYAEFGTFVSVVRCQTECVSSFGITWASSSYILLYIFRLSLSKIVF